MTETLPLAPELRVLQRILAAAFVIPPDLPMTAARLLAVADDYAERLETDL